MLFMTKFEDIVTLIAFDIDRHDRAFLCGLL